MKKIKRLYWKDWQRLAAQKIACNPTITIFRAFWRLEINALGHANHQS